MRVDLHIHTIASDGCWEPTELVAEVQRAGIGLFAAADHDTIESVAELEKISSEKRLNYVRAVEMSSRMGDKMCHILGYGIDPKHPDITGVCEKNTRLMDELNVHQVECLIEKGLKLDLEAFKRYTFDRHRGGGRALNFVYDSGHFKTFKDALEFVVKNVTWDMPGYLHPAEVISIIRAAGGHPILAHPGSSLLNERLTDGDIEEMAAVGLEGLECYTVYHTKEMIDHFKEFCLKRNLLITAGSDCHGPVLPRKLGEPEAYLKDLNLAGIWP